MVLLSLFGGIVWLAHPQAAPTDRSTGRLHVVAAENFWGGIAQQLGGGHVSVTSIIRDPSADPHLYESNAQNAAMVGAADVVLANGLGYDDFMAKLVNGSPSKTRVTLTAADIVNAPIGADPHLWYDYSYVQSVATNITNAYITHDPAHQSDYHTYAAVFAESLIKLDQTLGYIKQHFTNAPVAYTEPVPGYLLAAAGLSVKTPEGFAKAIEDGDEPSPSDATAMDTLMRSRQVKVLLYNSQATSPVTERVKKEATQAGIPIVGVSETVPAGMSYQTWQLAQLMQLKDALGR